MILTQPARVPDKRPAAIRRRLGLVPGSKLDSALERDSIRGRPLEWIPALRAAGGSGMLRCDFPGARRLADFDVAEAMRTAYDERPYTVMRITRRPHGGGTQIGSPGPSSPMPSFAMRPPKRRVRYADL